MQSRPTENSKEFFSHRIQESLSPPTQHGLDHNHEQSQELLYSRESSEALLPHSNDIGDSQSTLSGSSNPRKSLSRRLIEEAGSPTALPTDRITKYEKALTPSRKKALEGPQFKVVQKSNKTGVQTTSITDFPNGNLIIPLYSRN